MDKVFIRQLEIQTHIGVHAWEHHIRRPLLLDLDLGIDIREAAATTTSATRSTTRPSATASRRW